MLPRLQQPPAEVAFTGAPVEPMGGALGKLQGAAKRFDLLPFAARYIDIQARRRRMQRARR